MRENRPYGSEGGEALALPDPYHLDAWGSDAQDPSTLQTNLTHSLQTSSTSAAVIP